MGLIQIFGAIIGVKRLESEIQRRDRTAAAKLRDIEEIVSSKDNVINVLKRENGQLKAALERYGEMEQKGIVEGPKINYGNVSIADAICQYIKGLDDKTIPKIAKGPIIAWIKKNEESLNMVAEGFINDKVKDIIAQVSSKGK